ncbi:sigma-54-dependent transcriptional regulator [Tepidamorphus sp. 3E244]|uniref:nitrogen assimilation response regulator NtrX n=1 Tax=Tepidamorphus sp. 3E244 TaxID=3385498 RepID=UPI0038FC6BA2
MAKDILIVDDEQDIRELVAGILEDEGYSVRTAGDSDSALAAIAERRPSMAFLDIWIQGSKLDGLQLLDEIKKRHADLPVVMISGHGNIETAVSAIKSGAYDYIEKPFQADRLVLIAMRALEASRLHREVRDLKQRSTDSYELIGSSTVLNHLRSSIDRVGPTNSRVLVTGPSGAGKELTARLLHGQSARKSGPFVIINAASITPTNLESALFGVEEDGEPKQVGALEEAHGGTLFIDEIADMPLETQGRVLRALTDQSFQRVGGAKKVQVDVRIISSTARDLETEVAEGRFRQDLFHRLGVVPLRVPALSERRDDIPALIEHFMDQIGQSSGLPKRQVGDDAMAVLQAHDWPGNVRQLRNNVERLMILAGGDPEVVISSDMLPAEVGDTLPPVPGGVRAEELMSMPLRDAREIFEREYLTAQINRFGGNISRTAEFIGMERSALHRKLKSLGIG